MTRSALKTLCRLALFSAALPWGDPSSAQPLERPARAHKTHGGSSAAVVTRGDQVVERGALSRKELTPYLEQGPQPIMGALRIYPERAQGRFVGFKILMIAPGSPPERAGLMVGDVLLKINGQPIARPDQVMKVWSELPSAEALTLSLRRGQERLTYRWVITP